MLAELKITFRLAAQKLDCIESTQLPQQPLERSIYQVLQVLDFVVLTSCEGRPGKNPNILLFQSYFIFHISCFLSFVFVLIAPFIDQREPPKQVQHLESEMQSQEKGSRFNVSESATEMSCINTKARGHFAPTIDGTYIPCPHHSRGTSNPKERTQRATRKLGLPRSQDRRNNLILH